MLQDNNIIDKSKLNSDNKLYKYMDLEKFLSLVVKNEICFCKQSVLKNIDPYEGALTVDEQIKECITETIINMAKEANRFKYIEISNDINKETIDLTQDSFKPDNENHYYINCWHINGYESLAMWKVFSSNKNSIAISTTKNKLISSIIDDKEKVYIKEVEYSDLLKSDGVPVDFQLSAKDGNTFCVKSDAVMNIYNNTLLRKSKYYEYEQELRLFFRSDDNKDNIKFIKVNLDLLIDEIIISPNCDKWFMNILENVLRKYNIDKKINFSQITDDNTKLSDDNLNEIRDTICNCKFTQFK